MSASSSSVKMNVTKAKELNVWSKCGHKLELKATKNVSPEQFKIFDIHIPCAEISDSFNQMDKNGDGRISVSELTGAQRTLGLNPTRKEVLNMMKEIDSNDSGFIELNEYLEVMAERLGALDYEKQQMKAAFQHFDKDHSGKLSRGELQRLLTSNFGDPLTQQEFNDVIRDMDRDGDGAIDVDELCTMLCQMTSDT